uniref:Putative secreted protein n=1 Tax=Ixodes scapularis TaxID=6945 RepID=A0A4D5RCC2_IXOSC
MARGHHSISCLGRFPVIYLFVLPQCMHACIEISTNLCAHAPDKNKTQNFCVRSCSDPSKVFNGFTMVNRMPFHRSTFQKMGMFYRSTV